MTASFRLSMFRSASVLLVAIGVAVPARQAAGQACCASAGLVAPTRLRSYEDYAVGLQAKVRSVVGAYDVGGIYRGSGAGESEWDLGQDLFGVLRVADRGQVALLLPFIETRRAVSGAAAMGGGIGDVSAVARYDFISAGEKRIVPGLALVLGVLAPTGTPPEEAGDALAAGATGQGTWEGTVGIGVEQAFEPNFVGLNVALGMRTARDVAGRTQSFAPRLTASLVAGRVLHGGSTLGCFVTGMRQGENSVAGAPVAGSDVSLLTVGVASTVSPSDQWRLQGTASGSLPVSGFGRNQPAGIGVTLSVIRLWL